MNNTEFSIVKNIILKLSSLFFNSLVVYISSYFINNSLLETKFPNIDTIISKHSALNSFIIISLD